MKTLLRVGFCIAFLFSYHQCVNSAETKIGEYTFTHPDHLVIEKITTGELIKRPISASFDPQGNLYVTEASGTNEPVKEQVENKPHRVLRLTDTNGDGKFDKRTVFVDKISFPEGALFHRGSLYVAAPPSIWKFTDTDNDGVADKTEEWLSAKTLTHCANDLHGPYAGPDGYIYWCKGAFAEQTWPQADGSTLKTKASHIFRKPVEGGFVENVMTGGMDNPVEVAFLPTGDMFFTTTFLQHPEMGKRDGIIHAIHGAVYGKDHGVLEGFPRTGDFLPPLVHMGAAAPSGLMIMQSTEPTRGYEYNLFATSFNMHKVTRHVIKFDASAYSADDEDFLTCDSFDFHPTDVLEDADGSLLIVDTGGWYKICCPTSQLYKPEVLGGIYRLGRKDSHEIDDPRGIAISWDKLSSERLCELLDDNRPVVQQRAQTELIERGDDSIPTLANQLHAPTYPSNDKFRTRVIWTLSQIDDDRSIQLIRSHLSLADSRKNRGKGDLLSFSSAALILSRKKDRDSIPILVKALNYEPGIRRVAAEALGRIGDSSAVAPLLATCSEDDDRTLQHSLTYALFEIGDAKATVAGLMSDNPASVTAAMIALDMMPGDRLSHEDVIRHLKSPSSLLSATALRISLKHQDWIDQLSSHFEKVATRRELSPAERTVFVRFLNTAVQTDHGREFMIRTLETEEVINSVKADIIASLLAGKHDQISIDRKTVARLLESQNDLMLPTLKLIQKYPKLAEDTATADRLRQIAQDANQKDRFRMNAIAVIGDRRQIEDELYQIVLSNIVVEKDADLRSIASRLLRGADLNDSQLKQLLMVIPEIGPLEFESVLAAFGKSQNDEIGRVLLEKLPKVAAFQSVPRKTATQLLSGFGAELKVELAELFKQHELEMQQKLAAFDEHLARLPAGNAADGQKIFMSATAACSACHTVGYLGGKVGPDLSRIGDSRQKRDFLESILYPSASFVRGFEPMIVTLSNGKTVSGFIRDENQQEVVLLTSERIEVRVSREDIDEITQGDTSVMPAGLDKQLNDQQLADLLEFLKKAR